MHHKAEILVVDDIPANLKVLSEILASAGYTVAAVTSGERALKRLRNYVPDLILLDVQMPGIDGFETCEAIKKMKALEKVPVIFVTAFTDIGSIVRGFSVGAVDYINKPFQELELLTRVKTHLQIQMMNRTLEQRVEDRTHELQATLAELKASQLQLIQQEKMSALGNLVAGVAHEINNPLGFVRGNIVALRQAMEDITEYVKLYEHTFPSPGEALQEKREYLEIDFLLTDVPKMLDSMGVGCDRLRSISNSLRTFSRADAESKFKADVQEILESTLLILKYRLKAKDNRPEIEVIRDYGELPKIECFPGQLNQVFMNILANAIDMFDELAAGQSGEQIKAQPQQIMILTRRVEPPQGMAPRVEICIRDNGKGMTEDVCEKIFDRTFTTKAVGKGTGLGLAIAHQVITENHGGTLVVNSQPGQGTEFLIQLPVDP